MILLSPNFVQDEITFSYHQRAFHGFNIRLISFIFTAFIFTSDGFWCCFFSTVCFPWLLIFLLLFSLSLRSSLLILLPGNTRTFDRFLLVLPLDGDPFLFVLSISITQLETSKDASWASWLAFHYLSFVAVCSEEVCYQWDISHILQSHSLRFQNLSPVALRQAHLVFEEIPPSANFQFYGSLSSIWSKYLSSVSSLAHNKPHPEVGKGDCYLVANRQIWCNYLDMLGEHLGKYDLKGYLQWGLLGH